MRGNAIFPFLLLLLSLNSSSQAVERTPTSIKMKVYGVWVANDDCSNPIKVFENDSASVQDLLQNPTLGGGDIPDGSYGCVILKISDVIQADWNGGSCQADIFTHESYFGTAGNSNGHNADHLADPVNSPSIIPSANGVINEQVVYLYLSVNGTVAGACFNRPSTTITPNNGSSISSGADLLGGRFVVNGASAGTFKFKNIKAVNDTDCGIVAVNPSQTFWYFERD